MTYKEPNFAKALLKIKRKSPTWKGEDPDLFQETEYFNLG